MRILFIGKYPPLVGGVSSLLYWKARLLARAGFGVVVVSSSQQAHSRHRLIWSDEIVTTKDIKVKYLSDLEEKNLIPHSKALVTRLTSLACDIVEKGTVDLVESVYMEPNATVASLISSWFAIPHGIKHAGSDVGRLLESREYSSALKRLLKNSDYILTGANHLQRFLAMNINKACLVEDHELYPVQTHFNPTGNKLDLNEYSLLVRELKSGVLEGLHYYQSLANNKLDMSRPTLGIYSKASIYKGHAELIEALSRLKKEGYEFNLAILLQGSQNIIAAFYEKIEQYDLGTNTLMFPFIANEDIPRFIRACNAICYLENNFPIRQHNNSRVPMEVLFCGRHLIISDEVAKHPKLALIPRFLENSSVVSMNDPNSLYKTLKHYLKHVSLYQKMALDIYEGYCLSSSMQTEIQTQKLADFYVQLHKRAKENYHQKTKRATLP